MGHLVDLNDLPLLRRLLRYKDIDSWNRVVKAYMNDFYPEANLRFLAKDKCWKVTDRYFLVDVDIMLSNISLQWSGDELKRKLDRACEDLEKENINLFDWLRNNLDA